jgi:hypothetical protein
LSIGPNLAFQQGMKALFAIAIAISPCFALTITPDGSIPALHRSIDLSLDGISTSYYAGQIGVRFDNGSPALLFCADPLIWLRNEAVAVTAVPASSLSYGPRLAWLLQNYGSSLSSGPQAAALQFAAWDVVLDAGDGFTAGRLQARSSTDSAILALANTMLSASAGQAASGVSFYIPLQGASYSQTLFGFTSASALVVNELPEPGTFLLLGGGLLLAGAWRRGGTVRPR